MDLYFRYPFLWNSIRFEITFNSPNWVTLVLVINLFLNVVLGSLVYNATDSLFLVQSAPLVSFRALLLATGVRHYRHKVQTLMIV